MSKWDKRFLDLAEHVSRWSRDPSTMVGAVITDSDRRVVSVGFNGFAKGCDDDPALYANRDVKLLRVVHAEANAILFASKPLMGCTAFTYPFPPCARCAALVIQSGIARVVAPPAAPHLAERWAADLKEAASMFNEAGVTLDLIG